MYIIPEFNNQHQNPQNLKIETYNGQIKTLKDALLVLEGTRLGYLPKIKRRLNGLEREFIRANTIFAWNETECGMKRWTDGKNWSVSKVSGPFLTYRELDTDKVSVKKNGLIKQSFSLTTKQNQKLHLISYYTESGDGSDTPTIQSPSTDPLLKDLKPDANIYQEYLLYYDQYLSHERQDPSMVMYPPYQMPMQQVPYQMHASMHPTQVTHPSHVPSHVPSQVRFPQMTLQQPYPAMTPDAIPTHLAPQYGPGPGMTVHRMSVPHSDSSQMSPQLSEASTPQAQDPSHSPTTHMAYVPIPGPGPNSNRINTNQAMSQSPYHIYSGGYYQYPISYYYPNQMEMPMARPNLDRPMDRLENYPRDARTERAPGPLTQNSNNSSSSISTSPNSREGDNQTLKMLDKGFSNK